MNYLYCFGGVRIIYSIMALQYLNLGARAPASFMVQDGVFDIWADSSAPRPETAISWDEPRDSNIP